MLKSAGLPIPKEEFVHGYVTINGQKISKSLGNVIDPFDVVKKYDTDPVRYYLLREIPSYSDGDFSEKRFKEVYNADLANNLGNLVARVARIASEENINPPKTMIKITDKKFREYHEALGEYQFSEALTFIWNKISQANRYIDARKPWALEGGKLKQTLEYLVEEILEIALLLTPFLPQTAQKIQKQFTGPEVESSKPLFPRI